MDTTEQQVNACLAHLERFSQSHRDPVMQKHAIKALRFLVASDVSMREANLAAGRQGSSTPWPIVIVGPVACRAFSTPILSGSSMSR